MSLAIELETDAAEPRHCELNSSVLSNAVA